MDVVKMVLAGKVNKELVSKIQRQGGRAIGLCGLDGGLFKAKKLKEEGVDYGFVGDITEINVDVLTSVISEGYIPIVSTIAEGEEGCDYNINADTAAAKLAVALHAEKLILLTDVMGLMGDPKNEDTLIKVVNVKDIKKLIKEGVIRGGMIPKMDCCVEAVEGGVKRTHIIDGRIPHSILIEMLSDSGIGTMILKE